MCITYLCNVSGNQSKAYNYVTKSAKINYLSTNYIWLDIHEYLKF